MLKAHWFPLLLFLIAVVLSLAEGIQAYQNRNAAEKSFAVYRAAEPVDTVWRGDNKYQIPTYSDSGKLIWYGRELIANTAYYLGPEGTVSKVSNGLNCQNCHMDAGTAPYGNNFGKVYATYPQYRARNNRIQSIYDRINDCLERSLNGKALDSTDHEMQAMYAYIKWLGDDVPKGDARGGTGILKLKYLDTAADPGHGKQVYEMNCQSCHGNDGQGQPNTRGSGFTYPPLWGAHSYNDGAGLYRLSSFAGFVKDNMPYGTDYHHPKLTDEEAWDVAAFVNSQPRPHMDQSGDWKNIQQKPVDFPFGPYADGFPEKQHKYGPFKPILEAKK
ncbi:MAG: c-type cytochrome [Bacteroidota bacterium]|nr:c-type cytochrome [Bacteroidota bacterium]